MDEKVILVVGGGIVGLFSAILLKQKYNRVVLIERDKDLGGLLKSTKNSEGVWFDYGTHIPSQTLNKEIDDILFSSMANDEWEIIQNLNVGNFFSNELYLESSYPNTKNLPPKDYYKGVLDFLNGKASTYEEDNLSAYLEKVYGATFSDLIYRPLMKKFTGKRIEDLHTSAFRIFDISRLIVGTFEMTRELKESENFNSKSAYPEYSQNGSENLKYYPKNNSGIGKWIDILKDKALSEGVEIFTKCEIESVEYENNCITTVKLNNNKIFNTQHVVWSIAPHLLIDKLQLVGEKCKPEFRKMVLCNIVFNKNFLIDNHYLYCFDYNMKSYRITLYSNITKTLENKGIFNCTVEVFLDKQETIEEHEMIRELEIMGIVDKSYEVLSFETIKVESGFPIMTSEFIDTNKRNKELIENSVQNVILLGKARGEKFFMNNTIMEAYEELSSIDK